MRTLRACRQPLFPPLHGEFAVAAGHRAASPWKWLQPGRQGSRKCLPPPPGRPSPPPVSPCRESRALTWTGVWGCGRITAFRQLDERGAAALSMTLCRDLALALAPSSSCLNSPTCGRCRALETIGIRRGSNRLSRMTSPPLQKGCDHAAQPDFYDSRQLHSR